MSVKRSIPILVAAVLAAVPLASPAWAAGPGALKFDESSWSVAEEAGVAVVTVERSHGEDGAVTVQYATADGTATAGSDYTPVSGTLSWGHDDGSDRTFTVPILADAVAEAAETIQLVLSSPTGGATIEAGRGTAVIVILANGGTGGGGDGGTGGGGGCDDAPGSDDNPCGGDGGGGNGGGSGDDRGDGRVGIFKFDQRQFFAVESAGVAVISVERSHGETGAVSIDYSTSPGTATPGADYQPVSGTLSWGPGDESSKVFSIPVVDDGVAEGSETVKLLLSNPSGGAGLDGARATAILHLLDNGQGAAPGNPANRPGVLKFGEARFQVFEGGVEATVRVERSHGQAGTVSVAWSASEAGATDGLDFAAGSGILTWGPGDAADKTFTVAVFDDDLAEGNESIQLALAAPTGGATIDDRRGTATLTILDDDGSTAACVPTSERLCLAGGRFAVEVEWRTPQGGVGRGRMKPDSDASGLVWFFDPSNVEVLVKVLDACTVFPNHWVFYAATTNVDFTVTVTDTATGLVKQYSNPMGQAAEPVQDTVTFPCP
jgi:ribosomal protein L35AE/L33A